ncbi:MAG TPA: M14 family zinc carboxypeptidase [Tepidisphaeraceae bacterium]|nr:M14 family zinc carboxypeptidase [Tepidisphaeraceae bacterium]
MNGKSLAIVGASLTFVGAITLVLSVLIVLSRDRIMSLSPKAVAPAATDSPIASGTELWGEKLPEIPQEKQADVLDDVGEFNQLLRSGDAGNLKRAVSRLKRLVSSQPKVFAEVLPKLLQPLLDAKLYAETIAFARNAIEIRPQTPQFVAEEQRAIVESLMAQGLYDQALAAAKSYYNVATLKDTAAAIDLVADVLNKSRGGRDPTIGLRFKTEQASTGPQSPLPAAGSVDPALQADVPSSTNPSLDAITVDDSAYEPAIARTFTHAEESYGSLIGRGNLLLLADRPVEARQCFTSACRFTDGETGKLRNALEGIARAVRAQSGGITEANALITAIQQGDISSLPKDLTALGASRLQAAAQRISLAALPPAVQPPPLEEQREGDEHGADPTDQSVLVSTGFECSTPFDVKQDSPTHFELTVTQPQLRDWFMFRVRGVKGKVIRFDITDPRTRLDKWWSLNPVYAYGDDISDPSLYRVEPVDAHAPMTAAWNGSLLPSDRGQKWHWIAQTWISGGNTFSFVQRFDADRAFVAMRPPHPPSYSELYIRALADNPLAKVIEVGRSTEDRSLILVKISSGVQGEKTLPCMLFYAGEHADEHDAMWVAQGVIEYLVSDDLAAQRLRSRFTFLIIPMLDPDASVHGTHQGMIASFLMGRRTPESSAYANWFQSWIAAGNRLDLVFDFHNVQASESANVECALMEGLGIRGSASAALHALLVKNIKESGFAVTGRPRMRGWSPDRLGGWLSRYYGALTLAYEFDSQSPERHLNLRSLEDLGRIFVNAACSFVAEPDAKNLLVDIDVRRQQRLERWTKYGPPPTADEDAIQSESERAEPMNLAIGDGHEQWHW